MMVLGYWEQACALLNHGLLHEQLFFETAGEFFGVWERVKPIVPKGREMFKQKLFLAKGQESYCVKDWYRGKSLYTARAKEPCLVLVSVGEG